MERMDTYVVFVSLHFVRSLVCLLPRRTLTYSTSTGLNQPIHRRSVLASVCYAISNACVKWMSDTEPANRMVFIQNASLAVLSAGPAIYYWVDPPWAEVPWIATLALSGLAAHMCLTRAVSLGDSGLVMPFDYLRLPFAAGLGFFLYLEVPDGPTIIGGLVIIGAVSFIAATERRG